MEKEDVEIRNDDILLYQNTTPSMGRAKKAKSFFEWFKETDKWFEERNIPMIITVLADGIDIYPEWVKYIKERKHRFKIELHGHTHLNFRHILDDDKIYKMLMPAKRKIEKTFDVKITRWYAPFSRKGFPGGSAEIGMRVCQRMGIQFHTKGNGKIPHRYFHYWSPKSIDKIKRFIEGKNPIIKQ